MALGRSAHRAKPLRGSRLAGKLLASTAIVCALTLTVYGVLKSTWATIRAEDRIRNRIQEIASTRISSIQEALWACDERLLRIIAQSIVSTGAASWAAIESAEGPVYEAGARDSDRGRAFAFPIAIERSGKEQGIGTLRIQEDPALLEEARTGWIRDDLPAIVLSIVAAAACLHAVFSRSLARRLVADAEKLAGYDPNAAEGPFPVSDASDSTTASKLDELGALEAGFNALARRMGAAYRSAMTAREEAKSNEAKYQALFELSPVPLWLEDFTEVAEKAKAAVPPLPPGGIEAYLEARPDLLFECARSLRVLAVNKAALRLHKAQGIDDFAGGLDSIYRPGSLPVLLSQVAAAARGERTAKAEGSAGTLDGGELRLEVHWEVLPGPAGDFSRVIVAEIDVTARDRAEGALRAALEEKEILLRELFHRTKNNMSSILGLLSFQSWKIEDPGFRAVLKGLETRIYSMSLVHRLLYENEDLSRLSFAEYLREFAAYAADAENADERGVRIDLRAEEVIVSVDVAIPLGLIVAELLSNTFAHAFGPGTGGEVAIVFERAGKNGIRLVVEDDGRGPPPSFAPAEDGCMGLHLVASLAEGQLGGKAVFGRSASGGFRCEVTARTDLYGLRV